jgi:serine/threonine-protein kinase
LSESKKKLGKYAILGVAGRGGMGTVYMGHNPVIDRKVAIKKYTTSEVEFGSDVAQRTWANRSRCRMQ